MLETCPYIAARCRGRFPGVNPVRSQPQPAPFPSHILIILSILSSSSSSPLLPRYSQLDDTVVSELGGVGEQVEEGLPELGLVGVHGAEVVRARDDQGVAVLLDQRLDDSSGIAHELADLERLDTATRSSSSRG